MNARQFPASFAYFLPFVLLLTASPVLTQVPAGVTENTQSDLGGRHSIAGRVISPAGAQMETRIRIRLATPGAEVSTTTDETGSFLISGLTNGTYTLFIDPGDDFEPDSQRVDISVPAGSRPQVYAVTIRLRKSQRSTSKPGLVDAEFAGVPNQALKYYEKAAAKAKSGDTQGAVEQLLNAVSEYPDFFLAHAELGIQYQKLNELEKADQHLKQALRLKPDSYGPLANRGIVLVRLRKYAEAEPILRNAIKLEEKSPVAHFYLGRSLLGQKRPDEAEPEFKTTFAQGGNEMIEARRALATIYLERGENHKALAEIEAYLAAYPSPPDEKHLRDTVRRIKEWLKENPKT